MRLKSPTSFPLDMIVDVGVRNFKVRFEDDGIPFIHSKTVHGPAPQKNPVLASSFRLMVLSEKSLAAAENSDAFP